MGIVLASYNRIGEYPPGIHRIPLAQLTLLSSEIVPDESGEFKCKDAYTGNTGDHEGHLKTRAMDAMIYDIWFDIRPQNIETLVLYLGLCALDSELSIAAAFKQMGKRVMLMECGCDYGYDKKKRAIEQLQIPMEICYCGGTDAMGKVADYLRDGGYFLR